MAGWVGRRPTTRVGGGVVRNLLFVDGSVDGLSVARIACAPKTTGNKTEAKPW